MPEVVERYATWLGSVAHQKFVDDEMAELVDAIREG
jgi:hypothetical protein